MSETEIPIYDVKLYFTSSETVMNKVVKDNTDFELSQGATGRTIYYKNKQDRIVHVIGVFNGKLSTLVHEVSHCCLDICKLRGIPVGGDDTSEAYCYLVEYIYDKLYKCLYNN